MARVSGSETVARGNGHCGHGLSRFARKAHSHARFTATRERFTRGSLLRRKCTTTVQKPIAHPAASAIRPYCACYCARSVKRREIVPRLSNGPCQNQRNGKVRRQLSPERGHRRQVHVEQARATTRSPSQDRHRYSGDRFERTSQKRQAISISNRVAKVKQPSVARAEASNRSPFMTTAAIATTIARP